MKSKRSVSKRVRHTFKEFTQLWCCIALLFSSNAVLAQVTDVDFNIGPDNTVEEVTIDVPDGKVEIIRFNVYDADIVDEGKLFINGQGPIMLFRNTDNTVDGDTIDFDLDLSSEEMAYFKAGENTLRIEHERSMGFRIFQIILIGDVETRKYESIKPQPSGEVTEERRRALDIYKRLVGVGTPIDNPILIEMEKHIRNGNPLAAAQLATQEPGFYNHVVRDMAAKMSTKDETVKAPFNDFIATFIGVTRDETDARELLTGDIFYMGTSNVAVPNKILEDVVKSNRHYEALESDNYDYASVLGRVDSQYLRTSSDGLAKNPDAAGLITSRAFMEAHATAGTNRRLVEFSLRQFTCQPIEAWADASSPDLRVGRDIDRFPGGEGAKYQTTCKACHANMDAFRGAFAKYDFANDVIKYSQFYPNGKGKDAMELMPFPVVKKMNDNQDVFPEGYETTDDSWMNFARSPANQELFGWRTSGSSNVRGPASTDSISAGSGVKQFGKLIANSEAFSECMVQRVFSEVCKREPAGFEKSLVESMARDFEAKGYNLKSLFQVIATRPECLGK